MRERQIKVALTGGGTAGHVMPHVALIPEFQNKGLGSLLMEQIERYLVKNAPSGAFIGLMAAENTISFYERFGYAVRAAHKPGLSKYNK